MIVLSANTPPLATASIFMAALSITNSCRALSRNKSSLLIDKAAFGLSLKELPILLDELSMSVDDDP